MCLSWVDCREIPVVALGIVVAADDCRRKATNDAVLSLEDQKGEERESRPLSTIARVYSSACLQQCVFGVRYTVCLHTLQ